MPASAETATSKDELPASEVFKLISPSVAFIETESGLGSGLLIDDGYIATNYHVVWPSRSVRVVFPDGTELEEVPVAGWDPMADLAVLGPVDVSAQPLRLVDGESTSVGSELFLIGYQDEVDLLFPQPTITRGILSNQREWESGGITYLQSNSRIAGGQSGGALVNSKGEVIGLTTYSFGEAQNGLSASSADIKPILEKITQGAFASELGDRRLPAGDGRYEFEIKLRHLWDTREFVFEAEEGTTVKIEVEGDGDGMFSLFDSIGLVLDVDDGYAGVESAEVEITTSGIHFLQVEMASGGEPSTFSVTSSVGLKPLEDPDDGRSIVIGDTIAASLDFPGDWDWYSIDLQEGDTVRVSTDSLMVDTLLYVSASESEYQEFISDDDSGGGLSGANSEIVYRAPHTGEYFVVVTEAVEDASGGYYLSLETAPEDTPLTADDDSTLYQDSMPAESEALINDLYECLTANEIARQDFLSLLSEALQDEAVTGDQALAAAEAFLESRELFTYFMLLVIEAGDVSDFGGFLSENCQGAATQAPAQTSQPMADWLLIGDAERTPSGSVMLTPGDTWQVGALFYPQPMSSGNLRVEFSFEITGEGRRADGIVLVAARNLPDDDLASRSLAGGRLGNDLFTQAIAVEFDTWRNAWDTSNSHVGLSLMGDVTDQDHPLALAATELDLDIRNSGVYEAEVALDAGQLEVYLSNSEQGIDRQLVGNFTIPDTVPIEDYLQEYYIGLVATTGDSTDRHLIHEVRLEADGVAVSYAPTSVPGQSGTFGQYFRGETLHVSVVDLERVPELRYSTSDPGEVVRRWSLRPSAPGNELVLVRLKVENHTVDSATIDIDRTAAVLQATGGISYRPVSVSETVWQDFRGDAQALVRIDQGQCFDGARALIDKGTTVRWQSEASSEQFLDFENGSIEVGLGGRVVLSPGASITHTFSDPGFYPYVCGEDEQAEWAAEIWVMRSGEKEDVAERSVLFLEGGFQLQQGYGLDGYLVFEAPRGKEFNVLQWRAGDLITILFDAQASRGPHTQDTETLREYEDHYAGGPGAIYVGDINQLVGPAPTLDQGDFDGNVPLGALKRHLWIYESPFYEELLAKARLADPTPMTYDGDPITIQHVCINRALLPCRLMETYFAPNLMERTNGKLKFIFSSLTELGVSGTVALSMVTDDTLDSTIVYAGYVVGEIPHIGIQNLWGIYSSREQEFEASQAVIKDIEELVLAETGGVIMNHNWYAGNDQFLFCRDKIESLEDFRGKRIRSHSAALSNWINGMGATAQFVAFAEVYTAIERGILDCGVTGADAAYGQRWYEVTDYMIGPLLGFTFHSNVVSNAVWNSLTTDLQQILLEEAAKSELEALRLAAIQNEMGLVKNTTERGAGHDAMEFVPFSDKLNFGSLNTAAMEHVVPGWVNWVGDTSHPIIADTFNRKLGPIVGLRIEADGAVVRVPPVGHNSGEAT